MATDPTKEEPHKFARLYRMDARENALREFAASLMDTGFFRSCLNCDHWTNEDSKTFPPETCKRFNNARPPARIIATGCIEHTDSIPF